MALRHGVSHWCLHHLESLAWCLVSWSILAYFLLPLSTLPTHPSTQQLTPSSPFQLPLLSETPTTGINRSPTNGPAQPSPAQTQQHQKTREEEEEHNRPNKVRIEGIRTRAHASPLYLSHLISSHAIPTRPISGSALPHALPPIPIPIPIPVRIRILQNGGSTQTEPTK